MALHFHKPQNLDYATRYEDNDIVNKNNVHSDNNIGLMMDQLRREFHKSLDLNYPTMESNLVEFGVASKSLLEWQHIADKKVK